MNIRMWNLKGLNAPTNQKEVKILCNEVKVSLIGLLETKIKSRKLKSLLKVCLLYGSMLLMWRGAKIIEHG